MAIIDRFPHLHPQASWTQQQNAGDRLRALYEKDIAARHESIFGKGNAHLTGVAIMTNMGRPPIIFRIGLDYAFAMSRALVIYRAQALEAKNTEHRRHYVTQAVRIRDALCWNGLASSDRQRLLEAESAKLLAFSL